MLMLQVMPSSMLSIPLVGLFDGDAFEQFVLRRKSRYGIAGKGPNMKSRGRAPVKKNKHHVIGTHV